MPKAKDFFAKLKEQGKINSPEYDAFLAAMTDSDIPDVVANSIEENFMTMERASAHKDIHSKIRQEVLHPLDRELTQIYQDFQEYMDPLTEAEFKKEANTYNKLKTIRKLVPDIIEKVKVKPSMDEDGKRKLAEYEKNIQELTAKFTEAQSTYNQALTAQKEESEKQFHDFRLDHELESMGNKYTLAEAYAPNRATLSKAFMSEIKASNTLRLGEKDGRPTILILDEHGKPKFNGNTPVTVDSLLDEKYKPFLKQSGSGNQGQDNHQKEKQTLDNPNPAIRKGASTTSKMRT